MSGWSEDPMREVRRSADAAHAMETTLRYEQQSGRSEPDREGRFGRVPPTHEVAGPDARTTMDPDGEQERIDVVHYEVDPDAVAKAILARLLAGRTFPAPPDGRAGR
jgi:hypothetical protein